METVENQKTKPRRFQGCLIKKFPRIFQYHGGQYHITESHKKYLNNQINVVFLEEHPHPIPVDRSGDCIRKMNRKEAKTFSNILKRMSKQEKTNRTLSLKTD